MKNIFLFFIALLFSTHFLSAQVINAAGAGGAYTIANYPGNFTGYYDGFTIIFKANHNNPGPATMEVGAFGTVNILNTAGNALAANDILANQVVMLIYSTAGTRFQMVTTSGNVSAGGSLSGSGTATRLALFSSANVISNSSMFESAANIGVGAPPSGSYKFEVSGLIGSTGINETSDLRYKKNIFTIENALQKVMLLRGVNYDWRTEEFKEKNFVSTPQLGLIAQEVEKVIPQVVTTDASGFKAVEYSKLVALLIEAVKEQQKKIDALSAENQSLKNNASGVTDQVALLKADVKSLHDAIDILLKENVSLKTGQK
jgi:hypothetical protein